MIAFNDLRSLHAEIRDELNEAIASVIDSGVFVLGPEVENFERAFAEYCGTRYAIAVNSGTSALHLSLLAAGIGPGDEVITVSMTFEATVAAITYAGAVPVMVDVNPATWTMDPSQIEAAITPRTKAVIPVHLHGLMAEMEAIREISDMYGLRVIEDAAQAHGADRNGQRAGSTGDLAAFSFYPGKNLGALGEGGAVVTSDEEAAERVRMLRDWGATAIHHPKVPCFNYRMDAIQGAVLRVKLSHLEQWTEDRRHVAEHYQSALLPRGLPGPHEPNGSRHVYHVYAIRVADRATVASVFNDASIGYGIHYPVPVHLQPAYQQWGRGKGSLPVTEQLCKETLSLPIHPGLPLTDVELVAESLGRIDGYPSASTR